MPVSHSTAPSSSPSSAYSRSPSPLWMRTRSAASVSISAQSTSAASDRPCRCRHAPPRVSAKPNAAPSSTIRRNVSACPCCANSTSSVIRWHGGGSRPCAARAPAHTARRRYRHPRAACPLPAAKRKHAARCRSASAAQHDRRFIEAVNLLDPGENRLFAILDNQSAGLLRHCRLFHCALPPLLLSGYARRLPIMPDFPSATRAGCFRGSQATNQRACSPTAPFPPPDTARRTAPDDLFFRRIRPSGGAVHPADSCAP